MIKTKLTVRRIRRRQVIRPPGYSPEWRTVDVQQLIKTTYIGSIPIWRRVVDEEIIPDHVAISYGVLGYDVSGWQSKFARHIPAPVNRDAQVRQLCGGGISSSALNLWLKKGLNQMARCDKHRAFR